MASVRVDSEAEKSVQLPATKEAPLKSGDVPNCTPHATVQLDSCDMKSTESSDADCG